MAAAKKVTKVHFVCQSCGYESLRWMGRCPDCGEWNSLVEEQVVSKSVAEKVRKNLNSEPIQLNKIELAQEHRLLSKSNEFNRVLGGGIVPGTLLLIGGEPGIGKSTLMLQEAVRFASKDFSVLYISGEESTTQTKIRAARLGLNSEFLYILAETNIEDIIENIERLQPKLIIVDSIQTVYNPNFQSAPGSVSQVRECALQFLKIAKTNHVPIFLIGHVTKDGYLAGPKVLEHMVDTLLFFEGDREHFFRLVRAVKNRFGSTNEIGVFEMTEKGMQEVPNPSAIFLSERSQNSPGSGVVCMMEGTRPILVEIQALASSTSYGLPQRNTTGVDSKRLAMLLAVLEKRIGLRLGTYDIFVNAVGGVKITETSADLGIVAAIASSLKNRVLLPHAILIGEVGLAGEIRAVSRVEMRIQEAKKLGFTSCILPKLSLKSLNKKIDIELTGVESVAQALNLVFV
jgi:DNA repair protein RadA/Sms